MSILYGKVRYHVIQTKLATYSVRLFGPQCPKLTVSDAGYFKSFRQNTELTDLRIIICLRKSEVILERILVCNVIEN